VTRVVVADDDAATDPLAKVAYAMAVPPESELVLASPSRADFRALAADPKPTLVLFRDVKAAVSAREQGLPDGMLNLGNIHSGPGRASVSRSVFLDESDTRALDVLSKSGMKVRVQSIPSETAQPLPEPAPQA
jgi:PTS system mannose-specific IIB component